MTAGAPSPTRQLRMLELMRTSGLVLAGPDHPVLRYLELRRYARALPTFGPRLGKPLSVRAWEITNAGVAAALRLSLPARRKRSGAPEIRQIDLEEVIAATGSGGATPRASLPCSGLRSPNASLTPERTTHA